MLIFLREIVNRFIKKKKNTYEHKDFKFNNFQ